MKTVLKVLLLFVLLVSVALVAGYRYYVYVPAPDLPVLSGEYRSDSLTHQQHERSFSYYFPGQLPEKAPLLFVLHGSGQSGAKIRRSAAYEFDQLADERGVVVVYPDGHDNYWNDCRASADYQANKESIDDVGFVAAMVEYFQRAYDIDPARVFVVGHSNGAHMAYRLALESPAAVAGIAVVSANLPVDSNLGCEKSGEPVSVAIFNGTLDPINPYDGGLVTLFGNSSRGAVLSTADTVSYWRGLASASTIPLESVTEQTDGNSATQIDISLWEGALGRRVGLYSLVGSGHVIPSKRANFPRFMGPEARDISGPEAVLDFFLGSQP